jgi:hypothetical protein
VSFALLAAASCDIAKATAASASSAESSCPGGGLEESSEDDLTTIDDLADSPLHATPARAT